MSVPTSNLYNFITQVLENKFLITDTEFKLKNFEQKNSIDEIKEELINKSLFFLYFETDDKYCYHLDKIINFGGKYIIHKK